MTALIGIGLTALAAGLCFGSMWERSKMRPRRPTIDLKVARDEIEEMLAG